MHQTWETLKLPKGRCPAPPSGIFMARRIIFQLGLVLNLKEETSKLELTVYETKRKSKLSHEIMPEIFVFKILMKLW